MYEFDLLNAIGKLCIYAYIKIEIYLKILKLAFHVDKVGFHFGVLVKL